MSEDLRKAMLRKRGGHVPTPPKGRDGQLTTSPGKKDYSPIQASEYFPRARFVPVNANDQLYLYETLEEKSTDTDLPYLLFLHGGGYSGLTWGPVIKHLSTLVDAEFGALDIRGHGRSTCENESDLSTETVTEDLFQVVMKMNLGTDRPLILVGHSMGGAFAIHLATKLQEEAEESIYLRGVIVIDVVEGSALEALSGMQAVLRSRPKDFASLQNAIEWCVRSGQTRNIDSARVSMPGQLKLLSGAIPESTMVESRFSNTILEEESSSCLNVAATRSGNRLGAINEENVPFNQDTSPNPTPRAGISPNPSGTSMKAPPPLADKYVWRIDLKKTEPYWRGWFEGISAKFLSLGAAKMLLLAGVDRLDKELMVAQMQGKFQMQVLKSVGHMVHEDAPDRVAENIAAYMVRNKIIDGSEQIPNIFPGC